VVVDEVLGQVHSGIFRPAWSAAGAAPGWNKDLPSTRRDVRYPALEAICSAFHAKALPVKQVSIRIRARLIHISPCLTAATEG